MWVLTCDWRPWVTLASFKKSDKQLSALFGSEHDFPLRPASCVPTPLPHAEDGIKAARMGLCVGLPSSVSGASPVPAHPIPQDQGPVSLRRLHGAAGM